MNGKKLNFDYITSPSQQGQQLVMPSQIMNQQQQLPQYNQVIGQIMQYDQEIAQYQSMIREAERKTSQIQIEHQSQLKQQMEYYTQLVLQNDQKYQNILENLNTKVSSQQSFILELQQRLQNSQEEVRSLQHSQMQNNSGQQQMQQQQQMMMQMMYQKQMEGMMAAMNGAPVQQQQRVAENFMQSQNINQNDKVLQLTERCELLQKQLDEQKAFADQVRKQSEEQQDKFASNNKQILTRATALESQVKNLNKFNDRFGNVIDKLQEFYDDSYVEPLEAKEKLQQQQCEKLLSVFKQSLVELDTLAKLLVDLSEDLISLQL